MTVIESEGKTVEEALLAGCESLGLEREEVDYEVLREPKGMLGIQTRKALVRVSPKETPAESRDDEGSAPGADGAPPEATENGEATGESTREWERHRVARDLSFDPREALEKICRYIHPDCTVESKQEEDRLLLAVSCDGSGIFIGRYGQTLDALQHLINRMASKANPAIGRIVVDSENYRVRRIARLEDDAKIMAAGVKRSGRPASMEPMTAFDRRIIHTTLRDDAEVRTRSLGEGELKRVEIFLGES